MERLLVLIDPTLLQDCHCGHVDKCNSRHNSLLSLIFPNKIATCIKPKKLQTTVRNIQRVFIFPTDGKFK